MQTKKVRNNASKQIVTSKEVERVACRTLDIIADVVGSTLGPGGRSVLIERQETGLPAYLSKDGVTVFRNLGFEDPAMDAIMEVVRDAAVRTANEAGDGPQPLWSKVLTPDGFVKMGEVHAGMKVCGSNGVVQTVVGVYPKGRKRVVKVVFEGGRQVECCEDHLWTVTTNYGVQKTLTTAEMMMDFVSYTAEGRKFRYYVQKAGPVSLRDAPHPLDPYVVGALIGDGSLADSGSVELSLGEPKEHIIKKLQLPAGLVVKSSWVPSDNAFRVKIQGTTSSGQSIRDLLDEVGLRNCDSHSKFIPQEYLLGSVDARRALLQGLLDTDGHVNSRGRFEFSTVSDRLAQDFQSLCEGLGISLWRGLHTRDDDPDSFSDNPIHRFTELKGNRFGDKIVNIEVTDVVTEMQCIKVDSEDHLYVTDGYILTHNTTSATILAAALVQKAFEYCREHPQASPQRVVRRIAHLYDSVGADFLLGISVAPQRGEDGKFTPESREMLRAVACVSANGDEELAEAAVSAATELTGDWGEVVIAEAAGPSGVVAEQVKGYALRGGYEDSCGHLAPNFINDSGGQRCVLGRPRVICYNGRLTQTSSIMPLFNRISDEWDAYSSGDGERLLAVAVREGLIEPPVCTGRSHNEKTCGKVLNYKDGGWTCSLKGGEPVEGVRFLGPDHLAAFERYKASVSKDFVLLASGFGEEFVQSCMVNFSMDDKIHVFPLRVPLGPSHGYQGQCLMDVAAMAGSRVLDPVQVATGKFRLADLGPGVSAFEAKREVSNFLGLGLENAWSTEQRKRCEADLLRRVREVEKQVKDCTSTMDRGLAAERLAKLTGGLARIVVTGASNSEIRERKDRAEDAVCAVRGAVKSGCLPGAGWGLLALGHELLARAQPEDEDFVEKILWPALKEPVRHLFANAGFSPAEVGALLSEYEGKLVEWEHPSEKGPQRNYDLVRREWVDAYAAGLLDSAPAVVEAVRSACSIALTLGAMGGMVVYRRDEVLERDEAMAATSFLRNVHREEANERS